MAEIQLDMITSKVRMFSFFVNLTLNRFNLSLLVLLRKNLRKTVRYPFLAIISGVISKQLLL